MAHPTKSTKQAESLVDLLLFAIVILLIFTGFILFEL